MLKKLHQRIFEFMKYKQFLKPFAIGMHIMLLVVAFTSALAIGTIHTLSYYLISLVWITLLGHLGLKLYEIMILFLMKLTGKSIK